MPYSRELAVALDAAALAGRFVRTEYAAFVPIPDAPASISTHVDRGSQELILNHLHAAFPADGLCAEESTGPKQAGDGGRAWVVDPIDGTRGFAMKNGEFSVMIGLTVGGEAVLGVVYEPALDRLTYASVGGGCWTRTGSAEPTRCRVRDIADPSACILVQSRPKRGESPTMPERRIGPAGVLEMYSAGVKMAVVARGEADVYVNTYPNFSDWDICAGHVLVTEAGGRINSLRGGPVRYGSSGFAQRGGLVAGSAAIQDAVLARLSSGASL